MTRETLTSRDLRAGCSICHAGEAVWFGGNAQGNAARHHDATGHPTWCDVHMSVRYGRPTPLVGQYDIEAAIAAVSAA